MCLSTLEGEGEVRAICPVVGEGKGRGGRGLEPGEIICMAQRDDYVDCRNTALQVVGPEHEIGAGACLPSARGCKGVITGPDDSDQKVPKFDLQSPVLGFVLSVHLLYPLINKGAKQRARYSLKVLESIDAWTSIRYEVSRHRQPLRGTGTDEVMVGMTLSRFGRLLTKLSHTAQ